MPKVIINTPAPQVSLEDYKGEQFQLSNYKGKSNVLLVFNRGFT